MKLGLDEIWIAEYVYRFTDTVALFLFIVLFIFFPSILRGCNVIRKP